jgi:hypothetical protein
MHDFSGDLCLTKYKLEAETGLYYYGARYLNPKTSVWISADPALGEYLPAAPVDDEAKKRNGNLPGQGGVFNLVNLAVYHYAANNPVKYTDPTGKWKVTIGFGFGTGGIISFGRNDGQWSLEATVSGAVGYYGSYDATDSGEAKAKSESGVKAEAEASAESKISPYSASISAKAQVTHSSDKADISASSKAEASVSKDDQGAAVSISSEDGVEKGASAPSSVSLGAIVVAGATLYITFPKNYDQ